VIGKTTAGAEDSRLMGLSFLREQRFKAQLQLILFRWPDFLEQQLVIKLVTGFFIGKKPFLPFFFPIKFIFLLKKFIRFLFWPDVSLLKNTYSGDKISKYSGSSFERNRIPAGLGWLQVVEYWRLELLECRKHMTRKRFADFLSSSEEIKTTTVLSKAQ